MIKSASKLAILVLFFYTVFIFALPWVKYQIYRNYATKVIKTSEGITNQKLTEMLLTEARDLKIPVNTSNVVIDLQGSKKIVTIEYSAVIKPFYLQEPVELKFKIEDYSR